MTKEQVYDAEINPLMAKVIEICKREKIAMLANFRLGEDLQCITAILSPECDPTQEQLNALRPSLAAFAAFTITKDNTL